MSRPFEVEKRAKKEERNVFDIALLFVCVTIKKERNKAKRSAMERNRKNIALLNKLLKINEILRKNHKRSAITVVLKSFCVREFFLDGKLPFLPIRKKFEILMASIGNIALLRSLTPKLEKQGRRLTPASPSS